MALVLRDPEAGLSYAQQLQDAKTGTGQQAIAGVIGAFVAISSYMLLVPLVSLAANRVVYAVSGSPGDFSTFNNAAQAMENPAGMFTGHLALASLFLIAFVAFSAFHQLRPRWLHSVQPGFRWRYALLCFAVSLVVLTFITWAENGFAIGEITPQQDFGWFLIVILVTTPFQAAAEEYLYRGYLLNALTAVTRNRWVGVVASSLVFAAFHGSTNLPLFLYRFGFGLLAGSLVVLTGGLEAGVAAHVVNNLCSFVFAALSTSVAAALRVTEITWLQLFLPLIGFAVCGLAALGIGRKLQIATVTP